MPIEIDLEVVVLKRFFIKQKRKRYIEFVKGKRRKEFANSLAHCRDLRYDSFVELVRGDIIQQIMNHVSHLNDNKSCYVISENDNIDGKRMSIEKALHEVIGHSLGTLLVFGNAEIVYYEGETSNNRWISRHKMS
jgi:hypothetical protein